VGGVKRGGSSAVVTSGDPGNPTFLDVRHQYGPEHTTFFKVEMWGLWLALDCLDNETAAAGVLICSDSQWALNALKESGYSAHSILSPLRACLRGLGGCVCFQWVPAHCGLLGNERADEEARKAADLSVDYGAQRGRISFDSQVKSTVDRLTMPAPSGYTVIVLSGPFRVLQEGRKYCLPNLEVVAPYYLGKPGKGSKGGTLRAHVVERRRTWSTS
jgi:ribonuclease HI